MLIMYISSIQITIRLHYYIYPATAVKAFPQSK